MKKEEALKELEEKQKADEAKYIKDSSCGELFTEMFARHDKNKNKKIINAKEEEEQILNQQQLLKNKRQNTDNSSNYTFQKDINKEEINQNKLKKSILKQKKGESDGIVTAEDMEAYKMLKVHFDDPMRKLNK